MKFQKESYYLNLLFQRNKINAKKQLSVINSILGINEEKILIHSIEKDLANIMVSCLVSI